MSFTLRDKALRLFGGRCLVVKALPCKGVKVHKLKVAFISKILRFYGVKALNLEDLFATLWINNAEA